MSSYQLYTDGSHQNLYRLAGIGGYILSPTGVTVEEFSKVLEEPLTFSHHEEMAILYGLQLALKHGIKNLECFTDSSSLSTVLNLSHKDDYIESNPMLREIVELLSQFEEIKFNYIPREENKRADKLASQSMLTLLETKTCQIDNKISLDNFYCIQSFLKKDREKFKEMRKDIDNYLVFDFIETTHEMTIYHVKKENDLKLISQKMIQLEKNWTPHFVKILNQELNDWLKNQSTKKIVLILEPDMNGINKVMRGLSSVGKKSFSEFEILKKTCQKFEKIILHHDEEVLEFLKCDILPKNDDILKNIQQIRKESSDISLDIGVNFKA